MTDIDRKHTYNVHILQRILELNTKLCELFGCEASVRLIFTNVWLD